MSYSGRTCIPRSGDSCHSIQSENHHSWIPNFPNWLFKLRPTGTRCGALFRLYVSPPFEFDELSRTPSL